MLAAFRLPCLCRSSFSTFLKRAPNAYQYWSPSEEPGFFQHTHLIHHETHFYHPNKNNNSEGNNHDAEQKQQQLISPEMLQEMHQIMQIKPGPLRPTKQVINSHLCTSHTHICNTLSSNFVFFALFCHI